MNRSGNLDAKLRVRCAPRSSDCTSSAASPACTVTHDQIEAMTLGTRIAVMKGGMLQQLGTPQDIYNRPANTYVASFHWFAHHESGYRAQQPCTTRPGSKWASISYRCLAPRDGEVVLGVRPEHLTLQHDAAWRGEVVWWNPPAQTPGEWRRQRAATSPCACRRKARSNRVMPWGWRWTPPANWFDAQTGLRL